MWMSMIPNLDSIRDKVEEDKAFVNMSASCRLNLIEVIAMATWLSQKTVVGNEMSHGDQGTLRKQSSGSVERTHQSRDPEGCTYQSSDPEGYTYQSSDPEGCTYQSCDPEGCTYQSSDPEGCTYQSSDPEGCTYQSSDPEGYTYP
ncbi:NBS-LRR type resistance protein [Cucumis melo var. makuwa]|uniref:NBS-LRR type resistance protein n=1 Tax=Cucumis melo var. makuwa TaxID=1194695 RepID=A0A5D3DGW3_CUCMM|nr:NBS-LRR type resistance protein [Cucumis melo var. makuwa]